MSRTRIHARLALIAAATALVSPATFALEPAQLAAATLIETTDGSLVLADQPLQLRHDAAKVANACIDVDQDSSPRQRGSVLVNRCDHAVTVSYCIATETADRSAAQRCDAIGARGFTAVEIAAHSRSRAIASAPVGATVQWVACRADAATHSTLTDDGQRGECLVERGGTAVAAR